MQGTGRVLETHGSLTQTSTDPQRSAEEETPALFLPTLLPTTRQHKKVFLNMKKLKSPVKQGTFSTSDNQEKRTFLIRILLPLPRYNPDPDTGSGLCLFAYNPDFRTHCRGNTIGFPVCLQDLPSVAQNYKTLDSVR